MHPTRTTTKLLLGVACAVSAVSGCVNVSPTPTQPAGTSSGLPPHHEPRGGPGAAAVVVQAPALEALQAVPPEPVRPAASGSSRLPAPRSSGGPSAGSGEAAPAVPDIPEPRRPAKAAGQRPGSLPGPSGRGAEAGRELMRELPVRPADVCALGRRHGRWHPDSPEARICAGVHGG
ncbi:hypothetical protein AB0N28_08660 [Streptomyces sp. NPDC051130]|uniref:hypothetical protein n=1 Tax=Streptomyces sp. NPDC051130 TaxID=3157223 RepID=UPI003425F5F3